MQNVYQAARSIWNAIEALFVWIWYFSTTNLERLFNLPWTTQPLWKLIVILVVILVIVVIAWPYARAFLYRLVGIMVAFLYLHLVVLGLGLLAMVTVWFVTRVHVPALDNLTAIP